MACCRVGRTGRAGNKGTAITFINPEDDKYAPDLVKALQESKAPVPQVRVCGCAMAGSNSRVSPSGPGHAVLSQKWPFTSGWVLNLCQHMINLILTMGPGAWSTTAVGTQEGAKLLSLKRA
jgi:hypothetical protein